MTRSEPVAVTGMACRIPGAGSADAFWALLRDGVDPIGEVPPDRWNIDQFYDAAPGAVGKMNVRFGGFLDAIDRFDAGFFGISPREARKMDPQQRLLLEVAWEALEHANLPIGSQAGGRIGVFVGIGNTDFAQRLTMTADCAARMDHYSGTGHAFSIAANRLSYLFDLRGPSLAVDTACSSSLVAVHLACTSLTNGDCDTALAAGVNVLLSPLPSISFSHARMLAPDGRCKTFDAAANGYVRSEGCGVVVLRRLADAMNDGDRILAVVRGSAVNQDGHTSGITAPNGLSQRAVIGDALARAAITPDRITYVEAHGTGTVLGDLIELSSLATVLGTPEADGRPCWLGAVKASVGHLETAAGIASLIKVLLCLEHGELPAQLHLKRPNPRIDLTKTRLRIPTTRVPWAAGDEPRCAGVSSFGFGGTNAHVVVEEAPQAASASVETGPPAHVLTISAKDDGGRRRLADRYRTHLEQHPDLNLGDVCYTAQIGRSHFSHRLAIVGASVSDLAGRLPAFSTGTSTGSVHVGCLKTGQRPKVAFLFTGQGSQYHGMGRQLYFTEPTFRQALDRCAEIADPLIGRSLVQLLYGAPHGQLDQTALTQPALFAVEYALATLWKAWGVRPDVLFGHSLGEYVAACVAGVFSLEDGMRLVVERGRLLQALPPVGSMAAVFTDVERVRRFVAAEPECLAIAASNGPQHTVISGARDSVARAAAALAREGVESASLHVSHAFHSPLVDPMVAEFFGVAARVDYSEPRLPIVSNVTGQFMAAGFVPDADYWCRHLRAMVKFDAGIRTIAESGVGAFVEIGPQPVQLAMARRCLPAGAGPWLASLKPKDDDWSVLLSSLAEAYVSGIDVDWAGFHGDNDRRKVALPTYPFAADRHEFDFDPIGAASPQSMPAFESSLALTEPSFMKDHRIQSAPVVPAAAYIASSLDAAARTVRKALPARLTDLRFLRLLPLNGQTALAKVVCSPNASGGGQISILSQSVDRDESARWTLHATAVLESAAGARAGLPGDSVDAVRSRCRDELTGDRLYAELARLGFEYGPAFRVVQQVWRGDGEAIGLLRLPSQLESSSAAWRFHPALLDGCFHPLIAALGAEPVDADGAAMLPVRIETFDLFEAPPPTLWSHVRIAAASSSASLLEADVRILDERGQIVADVRGLQLQRTSAPRPRVAEVERAAGVFEVVWKPAPLPARAPAERPPDEGAWLIVADARGVGEHLRDSIVDRGGVCDVVLPTPGWNAKSAVDSLRGGPRSITRIVHLASLDADSGDLSQTSLEQSRARSCHTVLELIQAMATLEWESPPRVWLVTAGAHAVTQDDGELKIAQTPIWGLGRVIAQEHPRLRCSLVDLASGHAEDQAASLLGECTAGSDETQIAYRRGRRFVARLVERRPDEAKPTDARAADRPSPSVPHRVELSRPGNLHNLILRPMPAHRPGRGEVQIDVRAAGLNFRDVMKAMGVYPQAPGVPAWLGDECAGCVAAVGDDVESWKPGDAVVAIAPASLAGVAYTRPQWIVRKPSSLTFQQAAAIPIAFTTAVHALEHVARLSRNERVLIHAAAGGVGLAAVQVARWLGATVYATAGSDVKRAYLEALGIEHVMDSRSTAFADEVIALTGGRGVDVVLNSLSGEAIGASLSVLSPFGRFVEIGKRDIYENARLGLRPFRNSLSFSAVDMERLFMEQPARARELLQEVMDRLEQEIFEPLPVTEYDMDRAREAFLYMAQRRNIGKIVLSPAASASATECLVRADGAYLIVGGTGGLGLMLTRLLAERGASRIVLTSRKPATEAALAAVAAAEAFGAHVDIVPGDVADVASLSAAFAHIDALGVPLRGVVHAAGVLDDGLAARMDAARFDAVVRPKMEGAWNLHRLTENRRLDFFVLFSSAASILGSAGQANYAAGNAFLDGLAAYRQQRALPVTAVNWGPWADAGMAARTEQRSLARIGIAPLEPSHALAELERLIASGVTQSMVISADWPRVQRTFSAASAVLLRELVRDAPPDAAPPEATSDEPGGAAAEPRAANPASLERFLQEKLAHVTGLRPEQIDRDKPLSAYGFDSLLAMELVRSIEGALNTALPMETLTDESTIAQLAAQLAPLARREVHAEPPAAAPPAAVPAPPPPSPPPPVQKLEHHRDPISYGHYVRPRYAEALESLRLDVQYTWASGDRMAYERDGRRVEVLDMLGGYGSTLFGHNHPELTAHARDLLASCAPVHAQHSNRAACGRLARVLSAKVKAHTGCDYVAAFGNTGTEAIEAAVKHSLVELAGRAARHAARQSAEIATMLHRRRNGSAMLAVSPALSAQLRTILGVEPPADLDGVARLLAQRNSDAVRGQPQFLALERSFHGKTLGALCLTDNLRYRQWVDSSSGLCVVRISPSDRDALRPAVEGSLRSTWTLAEANGGELTLLERPWCTLAGAFVECVQGEGGIHVVPEPFFATLEALSRRYDFPIVVDEIQSGMGRCGTFLASEGSRLKGHYYCIGKSLGGGVAKISVVLIERQRYQPEFGFIHTSTFAEDEPSCSLALEALAILDREDLPARCRDAGEYLLTQLRALEQRHPGVVKEVRGRGLMIGLELRDQSPMDTGLIGLLSRQGLLGHVSAGYLLNEEGIRVGTTLSAPHTLRLEPSAFISRSAIDSCCAAFERLCTIVERRNSGRLVRYIASPEGTSVLDPIRDWRAGPRAEMSRDPAPAPDVAFVGHLIDESDLASWDPSLEDIAPPDRSMLLERMHRLLRPFVRRTVPVHSNTGDVVQMQILTVAASSRLIGQALEAGDTRWLVDQVDDAVQQARDAGCSVVGLGGFLSIVSRNGERVAVADVALTTGNAFTVAMGIDALRRACRDRGIDLAGACLGGVGAAGNICSTYLRLMAEEVPRLVLVGRARSHARLAAVMMTLYADAWNRVRTRPESELRGLSRAIRQTRAVERALSSAAADITPGWLHHALTEECGPDRFIRLADDLAAIADCDIVVTASNSSTPILFSEHLGERTAVVCDISIPPDVSPSVLERRPDVRVLRGGVVRLPNDPDFRVPEVRLPPGHALACMAETTLLGLERWPHHFSFGEITPGQVEWIRRAGERHGYELGYLSSDKSF